MIHCIYRAAYLAIALHFARKVAGRLIPDSIPKVYAFTHYRSMPFVVLAVAKDTYGHRDDFQLQSGNGYIRFRAEREIAALAKAAKRPVISLEDAARQFPSSYAYSFRENGPYYPHRKYVAAAVSRIQTLIS